MESLNVDITSLPSEVSSCIRFLKSRGVWYILSKNSKVISCKDAAANRMRLGNKGIPIFDELKSELGFFLNKENKKQRVLVHCRGNQKIDRLKISGILNSEYQRITSTKEIKGLVNPFCQQFRDLLQIFDISTTKDFHPPYTMMTNAGDFNYAIEFEVNSLINSLKNVLIEDIIRVDNYNGYKRHKIGILTGNGPDSGILLWKMINASVKTQFKSQLDHSFRGDLSYPEIVVNSVPDMGISMELDRRLLQTEKIVVKSTIDLCQNDISLLCIACNTTQYYKSKIEDICNLYNVKFVSMPDVINNYLKENKINEFDFLGLSYVVDFENLSAFKDLNGKYKILKPNQISLEKIKEIAYIAKKSTYQAANSLNKLIQNNTQSSTVIIALTEISTILSDHGRVVKTTKKVVDSLQLLADYIAKYYVDGIFDTLYVDKDKDSMKYELLNEGEKKRVAPELWNILCEINYEFVPPLSRRNSTICEFDSTTKDADKPKAYFDMMLKQEIIVCKKKPNDQVIGFMSFITNHNLEINTKNIICHYISTIGVTKGERGHGITNQFYKKIEEIAKRQGASTIATRTWATNKTHLKILSELKFVSYIIKDHRGEGIDTVYLVKHINTDRQNIDA